MKADLYWLIVWVLLMRLARRATLRERIRKFLLPLRPATGDQQQSLNGY
ncbi:hypothetical protein [Moorena sp. SIO3I8]|nr:hypothetical protein [Moorena sp. SIO3I8]